MSDATPAVRRDTAWYACLFCGHPRADALQALHALAAEVDDIVRIGRSTAHEVAHHKLHWWREEIARLAAGQPLHPLTRRLHASGVTVAWATLTDLLDAAQLELGGIVADEVADLDVLDQRRFGTLQRLAAALLAGGRVPAASLQPLADALGLALGRAAATAAPLQSARAGRLGLPLATLAAAGLPTEALETALADTLALGQHRDAVDAIVRAEAERGLVAVQTARDHFAALPAAERSAQRHAAVFIALTDATLQRVRRRPADRLHLPDAPPPWRTLLLAWRAARAA